MTTVRLTVAQATIRYLKNQFVSRDGREHAFFAGCFGIFGHGNVAGLGEALQENPDFRYFLCRNEQAMVHTAAAFARASNRLRTYVCTTSTGPGATNMVTGAAGATINRVPVLLLPGDVFARRNVAPVLQQVESDATQDISANDCFKPVSRYWDRIHRPDQLLMSLPEAMRVLTSPSQTGAVTVCLPQDVQAEAFEWPTEFFQKRVWAIPRAPADPAFIARAAALIRKARRPLFVAGGGVQYSEASEALSALATATGIAVCETQAGKGSLAHDHPLQLGAVGSTGTPGANRAARTADVVIGVGTRYSDFTTASKTAFQDPGVRFININVAEFDSAKHAALPLTGDARTVLTALAAELKGYEVSEDYRAGTRASQKEWLDESNRIFAWRHGPPMSQGEVVGAVTTTAAANEVVVCAAGSLPGDLHKLWRAQGPGTYHVEYGYSCMGYEIAGGLGVKLACPDKEVVIMLGDGSYLMMAQEIVTAVQENVKLTIVLLDNAGYASIGGLSASLGSDGFGTRYRYRNREGQLAGDKLPVDLATNAESLGAQVLRVRTHDELRAALVTARASSRTTVVAMETDREKRVGGYESWWDVPVSEVSTIDAVKAAREHYEAQRKKERYFY